MYPDVFLKFDAARTAYGNLEVLPAPQFFYDGARQEIAVELEPEKPDYKISYREDAQPDGTRTIFFELTASRAK